MQHEPVDPKTGSHPKVNFDRHRAIKGELSQLADPLKREQVIDAVIQRTVEATLESVGSECLFLIEDTLYQEQQRLKKSKRSLLFKGYTARRNERDRKFYQGIRAQIAEFRPGVLPQEKQKEILTQLVRHFAEEICGNFSPRMYDLAIFMVPWFFSWLLNAISLKKLVPWGMSESLATRLRIVGEVDALQKFSKEGTLLMVPTHLSNIDSLLIGWIIHLMSLPPFAYGAGLNLFSNPALAFSMSRLGAYTVDRKKNSELYKNTLKSYSTEILKHGIHSIFFPGGGRSRNGALENHLKLGLLSTALQAQIENAQKCQQESLALKKIYVVPVVMSYHFVFEAPGLIEEYLEQSGKYRFSPIDGNDVLPVLGTLKFFWKLFSSRSEIYVRIGKAMDVLGNLVDEQGQSLGPHGIPIDLNAWLTTRGELKSVADRDIHYTQLLGESISKAYHRENVVLSSHAVAFVLFQILRKQYPHFDLYKILRLSPMQRSVPYEKYLEHAGLFYQELIQAEKQGRLKLSDSLKCGDVRLWVEEGIRQLGLFHSNAVVVLEDQVISTHDMNLLYYYRNRLTGYGFGRLDLKDSKTQFFGEQDEKGFLV